MEVTNKPGSETIYRRVQLVIEVTGIPFDRYMEEQIMKPLGMKSSSFYNVLKTITFKSLWIFWRGAPSYQFTEQAAGLKTNVIDMMTLILASMDANNKGMVSSKVNVLRKCKASIRENGLGIFEKLSNQWKLLYHSGDNRGWHSFYGFILIQRMDW